MFNDKQNDMKRAYPTSTRNLTNTIKNGGFDVSTSYGRNAGSVIVLRSKGFNVSKSNKLSKLGENELVEQYVVTSDSNEYLEEIKKYLISIGYITSVVRFQKLFVAGQTVKTLNK